MVGTVQTADAVAVLGTLQADDVGVTSRGRGTSA
jgi:hypothetical protein